jgi:hypothetical protein
LCVGIQKAAHFINFFVRFDSEKGPVDLFRKDGFDEFHASLILFFLVIPVFGIRPEENHHNRKGNKEETKKGVSVVHST